MTPRRFVARYGFGLAILALASGMVVGFSQTVERILWAARTNAKTVDEEKQNRAIIRHATAHVRDKDSICYGVS